MESRFRLTCDRDDVRIDAYLSEKLSLPRSRVKSMIEGGHVRVKERTPKPSFKVRRDMEIEGEVVGEEPSCLVAEDIPITILYEDDYLLVIDKPKNMVVHPSLGHRAGTLVNAILSYVREADRDESDERPGIVHRLDKGTTGVIIVAKDRRTQESLSLQFHERAVEKVYRAIVEGVVRADAGAVEGLMGRHPRERQRMALVARSGRYSLSRFKVIERLKGFTYVEVYPETGRTHQIRVHLSHIGHPIVGDDLYGRKARKLAERPLLHAHRIRFTHPVLADEIVVEAPIPEDMKAFLKEHNDG